MPSSTHDAWTSFPPSDQDFIPLVQGLLSPSLSPHDLSSSAQQAVQALLQEGESLNTRASYCSAWRYWAAWYSLRYGRPIALPLPAACVLQFIIDHALRSSEHGLICELPAEIDQALVARGHKGKIGALALNTLVHRIAVLSKAHQTRELKNPCQDPQVRALLSSTRKAYARRGMLVHKKGALTRAPLQSLLATCDDTLRGLRDRAILLFAWASGGRRRSEVADAHMACLRRLGEADFIYTLAHSKTNRAGTQRPENHKPVVGAAGRALEDWLRASGIREGAIFRRIRRGGQMGETLSAGAIREIVLRRCVLAGLDGDYSAHSLRAGFVTDSLHQNMPLAETMALTGHQSVSTLLGYFRVRSLGPGPSEKELLTGLHIK